MNLGIITQQSHRQLWRHLAKHGWHLSEPGDQYPPEQPRLFEQTVYRALAEDLISESKAAELLGISLGHLAARRRMSLENEADVTSDGGHPAERGLGA